MSAQGIEGVIILDELNTSGIGHLLDRDSMIGSTGDPEHTRI
jgi:hypothetical protein